MGYSYLYPAVQTADYTIKFIHNDFLQQALDTGIIPMLMLIYLMVSNILSKNSSTYKKQILVIMLLHMLLEFDMQFLAIQFILVALLEQTEAKVTFYKIGQAKIVSAMLIVVLIGILGYFGVASFAEKTGNYKLALDLLPNKTSANVKKLSAMENLEQSEKLANEVLQQNQYVAIAYKIKANYAYYKGNWEQMIKNQKQAINLNKYYMQEYEDYIFLISNSLEKTVIQQKEEETSYLVEEALKVTTLLEQTKKNTNPLAYKTVDKPELELSKETKQYLEVLQSYQENKGG